MKRIAFILSACAVMLFASCKSTDLNNISTDLYAAQLLQLGQDSESSGQYKVAETYFITTIQRFGLDNAIYVEARYELGNCYLKEKQYDKARACFSEILSIYEDSLAGALPPAYNKLAKIGMSKLPEKN